MRLYQLPYSHNCAKVKIALLEKGLEFEAPVLPQGFLRSAEFLSLNPLGKVPYLQDGEFGIGESEVIVEYLEERYPSPPLLPPTVEGRARSRWFSRYHDMYLGPQLSVLFFALSDGRAGKPEFEPEIDKLFEQVAQLEALIDPRPYLMGEQFTLADAPYALSYHYILVLTAAHKRPLLPEQMPKLSAWFAAVTQRPAVAQVLAAAKEALGG